MDALNKFITADLLLPVLGMLVPVLIVLIVMHYRHRRAVSLHETLRMLSDKGQPIPKELLDPPRKPDNPLMTAMILIGAGGGLGVYFVGRGGADGNWGIGAIPFLMGVAQLIAIWLQRKFYGKDRDAEGSQR